MGDGYVLALDIGTSNVKSLLIDPPGHKWWTASESCRARFGAGLVEASADEWWQAARRATGAVLAAAEVPAGSVGHVALTGNMSSVVLVDGRGRPVREAILLADTRGEDELAALPEDVRQRVGALSGNPLGSSFTLPKLLWLAANEKDSMDRAAVWLAAKDFVRCRLTGTTGTDPSDAYNCLLLDPMTLQWRWDLVEEVGLDPAKFPTVNRGDDQAGEVCTAAARATGLRPGTPVSTGLGDMAALALGAGWREDPTPTVSLGTSTTILFPVDQGARPAPGFSVHPVLPGVPWFVLGSLLTGGLALDWLRGLGPLIGGAVRRGAGLVFLPQLSGRGSPSFDPSWRGSMVGLTPSTTLDELAQALFDAIAFELRACLEGLGQNPVAGLMLTGGGSAVLPWDQAIADVLKIPVRVLRLTDVTVFGAASLALTEPRWAEISAVAHRSRLVEPQDDWDVDQAYDHYLQVRTAISDVYGPRQERCQ
jgi:xylulokinase